MAAEKKKSRSYPDPGEIGHGRYDRLWEEHGKAYAEAIASLPSNTDQGEWASASPVIARASNGSVLIGGEAYAGRGAIFEELRRRASAPKAFRAEVPASFEGRWEAARRSGKNEVPSLLDDAIAAIEEAFPGCAAHTVKVASVADVEIDGDGFMKAKAAVAAHTFASLLEAAVSGLSFSYGHAGPARECRGYDKPSEMPLARAVDDKGRAIGTPVVKEGKACFSYRKDRGFPTHTGWFEDWREYPCETEDVAAAKAFAAMRGVAQAHRSLLRVPEKSKPETWTFLPKGL